MPPERLTTGQWMHNNKELRDHLAKVFSVPQSKATEIRDQDILSDGRSYDDLMVITKEKMCEYIGSEETFGRAWEITCAKGWSELHPPVGTISGNPKEIKTVFTEPAVSKDMEEFNINTEEANDSKKTKGK